jgi:hypothetical protein
MAVLSFFTDLFLSKLHNLKGRQLFDSDPRLQKFLRATCVRNISAQTLLRSGTHGRLKPCGAQPEVRI